MILVYAKIVGIMMELTLLVRNVLTNMLNVIVLLMVYNVKGLIDLQ